MITLRTTCVSMTFSLLTGGILCPFAMAQSVKTFPSYQAAATAIIQAAKAKDQAAFREILGADEENLLSSGDPVADERARVRFVSSYQEQHSFVHSTPDKVILAVGKSAWPMPIPIVRENGSWHFDAEQGVQELVYRRIGHNELDTIKALKVVYLSEKNYAEKPHDGIPAGTYADKLVSSPGKHDGLYWVDESGKAEGPAGGLVALASDEGYSIDPKKSPFHGYFYKLLKEQGPHATGGARHYVKDGRMTGGFAILAYPAEYGASGVMTFIMGPHGTIYQKDLGDGTADAAKGTSSYDPDSSWKVVQR
jgi:hypothetical protein